MAGAVEGEVVRGSHANVALAHGAPRRGLLDLPARLDDAVRLLPLEEGEGRVVVLGNRAGGRRMGERVLRRHGGDRGTRRGRQGANEATRGVSCDRGGSDNEGSRVARARGPCPTPVRAGAVQRRQGWAERLALNDLKNDSSSVVLPKPASPTTIKLNDSRGGSRERRGSMLRLWYGSRVGEPIERDLASRSRRYSSPITPVQGIAGDHRAHRIVAAS